ncbi:MAG: DNA mismatch endonuclease Vsr [Verrucomicrobia bacterium]|jgi:DNA mismatch endonuclease (patch repair protein)|nr:DNA mismatch endonuclease Vsr [Verrucomicrobiota bacterium]
MAAIRHKNTTPELLVRKALHALGFRYRLHYRSLPSTPDLVLPRYRAVINVNGCFWHGHDCYLFKLPATRTDFWREKIRSNMKRDMENVEDLLDSGWRVCIVWECSTRGSIHRELFPFTAQAIAAWLEGDEQFIEFTGGESAADIPKYGFELRESVAAEQPIPYGQPNDQ